MIDVDELQRRLVRPDHQPVKQSLREVGFWEPKGFDGEEDADEGIDLLATYAGQAPLLKEWSQGAQINTDRNLRLQFLAGMSLNSYMGDADPVQHPGPLPLPRPDLRRLSRGHPGPEAGPGAEGPDAPRVGMRQWWPHSSTGEADPGAGWHGSGTPTPCDRCRPKDTGSEYRTRATWRPAVWRVGSHKLLTTLGSYSLEQFLKFDPTIEAVTTIYADILDPASSSSQDAGPLVVAVTPLDPSALIKHANASVKTSDCIRQGFIVPYLDSNGHGSRLIGRRGSRFLEEVGVCVHSTSGDLLNR